MALLIQKILKNTVFHIILALALWPTALLYSDCPPPSLSKLYQEKPAFYSYIIGAANSSQIYDEYLADVYAAPASCQKTITALLAFKCLGPDYQYSTKLYTVKGSQDLVISFSGDPTFTSQDLLTLLKSFKNKKFNGKLILDASVFQTPSHSPNIMLDDIGSYYGQPVSSITIDENLFTVTVRPTKTGQLAHITNDLAYEIESNLITNSDTSVIKLRWNHDRIKASGNININDAPLEFKVSPQDLHPYILRKLAVALKTLNIQAKVEIVSNKNKLPANLALAYTTKSKPLKDFIIPAMKTSDNLVFDALYLKIINSQTPDGIEDWSDGDKILRSMIKQYFHIDMNEARLVDGSGLSRYNRIQPRKLLEILRQGFQFPEFLASLPSPIEIRRSNLPSDLKVKQGGMTGVSCLCGYTLEQTQPKAFVIMTSSFPPPFKDFSNAMDQFIKDRLKVTQN